MILRALPDANKDFARGGFFGGWVNGRKSGSGGGLEKRDVPKRVHCSCFMNFVVDFTKSSKTG